MIRSALRAEITSVDPAGFRIEGARALLRISGEGVGVIRCCDQRRIVSGIFVVELRVPVSRSTVEVVLYAVAGVKRRVVTLTPTHRIVLPSLPANTNARALGTLDFERSNTQQTREGLTNALLSTRMSLRMGQVTCTSHIPPFGVDIRRLTPARSTDAK
jgi:hypothetical protein